MRHAERVNDQVVVVAEEKVLLVRLLLHPWVAIALHFVTHSVVLVGIPLEK